MDCSEGEGLWIPTVFMIYGDNRFQFYTGLQQAQNWNSHEMLIL